MRVFGISASILCAAVILSGCVEHEPTPMPMAQDAEAKGTKVAGMIDGFTPIATRAELLAVLDGKQFVRDDAWWRMTKEGRLYGQFGDAVVEGTWDWEDGAYCREFSVDSKPRPRGECQNILVKGNQLMFIKERGAGAKSVETLKPI